MTRNTVMLWLGVSVVSTMALWNAGSACLAARSQARTHIARLAAADDQQVRLAALTAELPGWATRTPTAGLAPRVADALAAAGLPSSLLDNLSAQADSSVAGVNVSAQPGAPTVKSRKATLTLASITLPQLGRFLESWRSREPDWVVSNIDLSLVMLTTGTTPSRAPSTPPGEPSGELPLRAVISIESLLVESSGATQ